jgi:uncharacterized protein Veg
MEKTKNEFEETYQKIASIKEAVNWKKGEILKIQDENKRKEEIKQMNIVMTEQLENTRVIALLQNDSEKLNTEMRKMFRTIEEIYKPMEIK